jgi:hypothetical protein
MTSSRRVARGGRLSKRRGPLSAGRAYPAGTIHPFAPTLTLAVVSMRAASFAPATGATPLPRPWRGRRHSTVIDACCKRPTVGAKATEICSCLIAVGRIQPNHYRNPAPAAFPISGIRCYRAAARLCDATLDDVETDEGVRGSIWRVLLADRQGYESGNLSMDGAGAQAAPTRSFP